MAKTPNRHPAAPAAPAAKRKRGRPPSPNGPKSQAEIQRAYRARLAAAGKLVRLTDAVSPAPANQALAAMAEFDPTRDGIFDREMVASLRDRLHDALLDVERQREDVARLTARNAYLEGELVLQHQHHTNALKANIVLKQQLAEMAQKPPKRRP